MSSNLWRICKLETMDSWALSAIIVATVIIFEVLTGPSDRSDTEVQCPVQARVLLKHRSSLPPLPGLHVSCRGSLFPSAHPGPSSGLLGGKRQSEQKPFRSTT